ncbi:MAG: Cof-type HAD-IIB family hydrolase [Planctomycetota bacterium]|nr:Cof-type HAD-IIB family hydrolase [Planctomycetota bacterium]
MNRPELIALDLDGTLLDSGRQIPERAARALGALRDAGVHVVLATGRPPRMTRDFVLELGLDHALVFNGASRYHAPGDTSLHHHELDREAALEIIARLRNAMPGIGIGMETAYGWFLDEVLDARRRNHPMLVDASSPDGVGDVEGFVREGVIKIFARHGEHDAPAMATPLDGIEAYITWSHLQLLEVMHPAVNKRDALERYAAEHGVAREAVAAFGDQQNDIEMLTWVGHGVAMANASEATQAAADEVTASNDEHGVALVLERWL